MQSFEFGLDTFGDVPDQRSPGKQLVRYRIDSCHIQRCFDAHLWQNAGPGTCK